MTQLTNAFTKFLVELKANNNRDWFNENKKRFISDVKEPFELFIGEMIDKVHAPLTTVC